jgi:hypothetical protein
MLAVLLSVKAGAAHSMGREELEHLRETLRKLTVEVENLAIENDAYLDILMTIPICSREEMKNEVDRKLADPEIRKIVRQRYSEMWKAMDDAAMSAWSEEQLHQLPPTDKPN